MNTYEENLLAEIADIHGTPEGAYNIRANGKAAGRASTANIEIVSKEDKPGIDIIVKPGTKHESVHIPVIISESDLRTWFTMTFTSARMRMLLLLRAAGYTTAVTRTVPMTASIPSILRKMRGLNISKSMWAAAPAPGPMS